MFLANKLNKGGGAGGYQISRSLRFNSADSAYLNRTPASAGNRRTFTFSAWVKRSALGSINDIFGVRIDGSNGFRFSFNAVDRLDCYNESSGSINARLITEQNFRDPSAWYHIVLAIDTTNATAGNRMRLYINGSEVTVFDTDTQPSQNTDTQINTTNSHGLGFFSVATANLYMTEVNFVDGQALTPSSFGATSTTTGVWAPIRYAGTYGTNGFYLNFSDNSNTTAATLGKDYSGNSNNWTPNGFLVSAGVNNDSLVDSPTSYGTDTGVGGTVRGNYNTWNPLKNPQVAVLTNGNLDLSTAGSTARYGTYTTIGVSTGQWYWEITAGSLSTDGYNIGIVNASKPDTTALNADTNSYIYLDTGAKGYNGTGTAYGATYTAGDVIGVALDLDAGTLTFYKNGTSQGTAFTGIASNTWFPTVADNATGSTTGSSFIANFGQRPFAYTAPSGFKALCTQNLPTPTIGATTATQAGKYFNAVLWTGNSTANTSITGVGFQPDLVWGKDRSTALNHRLFDAVRGVTNRLSSNLTAAETTESGVTAFNSDGFTLGSDQGLNFASDSYVAWNWKANGSGSTNTAGQITSTVSASTTSGFSIVTFTADGTTKTVGHGLGVKPSLVIVKVRNAVGSWITMTDIINGSMQYSTLNSTAAFASIGYSAPTSSVFQYNDNNGNTQVAYCFAPIAGYSAFGSYTGNGSTDGPFVFTGFRPAFIMRKRSDSAPTGQENWVMQDVRRSPYNQAGNALGANRDYDEATFGTTNLGIDILSNGFKVRDSVTYVNASGGTYIYMAFAENPFKYSLAR